MRTLAKLDDRTAGADEDAVVATQPNPFGVMHTAQAWVASWLLKNVQAMHAHWPRSGFATTAFPFFAGAAAAALTLAAAGTFTMARAGLDFGDEALGAALALAGLGDAVLGAALPFVGAALPFVGAALALDTTATLGFAAFWTDAFLAAALGAAVFFFAATFFAMVSYQTGKYNYHSLTVIFAILYG